MVVLIIAAILQAILMLALWEGVVLGIAWLIGKIADISVNYPLVGGIVLGLWILAFAIQALYLIGTYKESKKIERKFDRFRL